MSVLVARQAPDFIAPAVMPNGAIREVSGEVCPSWLAQGRSRHAGDGAGGSGRPGNARGGVVALNVVVRSPNS